MSRKAALPEGGAASVLRLFLFPEIGQRRDEESQARGGQHTDQKLEPVALICHGRRHNRGDVGGPADIEKAYQGAGSAGAYEGAAKDDAAGEHEGVSGLHKGAEAYIYEEARESRRSLPARKKTRFEQTAV